MSLRDKFEQLEARERKLLFIFVGVLSTMILIFFPLGLWLSVGSQEDDNARIREIITQIDDERGTLGRRQDDIRRVDNRYARPAPPLASFLAQIADQVGVEIPETQDRSTVPRGKTFKERVTKIRLRNVGMLALSNFMDKISNSGFAVSITKLNIKKRGTKPDEFDAEMEVSAFDRDETKKKPTAEESGPSKDGDEDADEEEEEE